MIESNSIRTLFLVKSSPYPPLGGASLRNWYNIKIMMKFGAVAVVSICLYKSPRSKEYPPNVDRWQDYSTGDILKRRSLWRKLSDRLWWIRPYGHPEIDQFYSNEIAQELEQLLEDFQPHLVILEEFHLYHYLKIIKPHHCQIIYSAHNIEAPLSFDIAVSNQKSTLKSKLLATKIASIERYLTQQVDQVWVCSQEDAKLLPRLYPKIVSTQIVAHGIEISDYNGDRNFINKLEPNPFTLLFTGTFAYYPNSIAAEMLIDQIYPQLKQLYPHCRLILAGHSPTSYMQKVAQQNSDIVVTGKVKDIQPYFLAASVVIVPLQIGGGSRLKILEAFAANRPVVSTTKGAEGLKVKNGEHLLIRDTIEEMVKAINELWTNPLLGRQLTTSAYQFVQQEHSETAINKQIEKAINRLILKSS